jgi:hypothetical protein
MHPTVKPSKKPPRKNKRRRDDLGSDSSVSDASDPDFEEEEIEEDHSGNYAPVAAAAAAAVPSGRSFPRVRKSGGVCADAVVAAGLVGATGARGGHSESTLTRTKSLVLDAILRTFGSIEQVFDLFKDDDPDALVKIDIKNRTLSAAQCAVARVILSQSRRLEFSDAVKAVVGAIYPTNAGDALAVFELAEDLCLSVPAAAAAGGHTKKPIKHKNKKSRQDSDSDQDDDDGAAGPAFRRFVAPLAAFPSSVAHSASGLEQEVRAAQQEAQTFNSELRPFLAAGMIVAITMKATRSVQFCRVESIQPSGMRDGWLIKIADPSSDQYVPLDLSDISEISVTSSVLTRFMSGAVVFSRNRAAEPLVLVRGTRDADHSFQLEKFPHHCIFVDYLWPHSQRPMDTRIVIVEDPSMAPGLDRNIFFHVNPANIQFQRMPVSNQQQYACAPASLPPSLPSYSAAAGGRYGGDGYLLQNLHHDLLDNSHAPTLDSPVLNAAALPSLPPLPSLPGINEAEAVSNILQSPPLSLFSYSVAPPSLTPYQFQLQQQRQQFGAYHLAPAPPPVAFGMHYRSLMSSTPPPRHSAAAAASSCSPVKPPASPLMGHSPFLQGLMQQQQPPRQQQPLTVQSQMQSQQCASAAAPSFAQQLDEYIFPCAPPSAAAAAAAAPHSPVTLHHTEEALRFAFSAGAALEIDPLRVRVSLDHTRKHMNVDTSSITANGWSLVSLAGDRHLCFWHIFRLAFLNHENMRAHKASKASEFISEIKKHCLAIVDRLLIWPCDVRKWRADQLAEETVTVAVLQHVSESTGIYNPKSVYPTRGALIAKYTEIVMTKWGGMAEARILSCGTGIPETAHYGELRVHSYDWSTRTLITAATPLDSKYSVLVACLHGNHFGLFTRTAAGQQHPFLIPTSDNPVQLFRELLTRCRLWRAPSHAPNSGDSDSSSVQITGATQ